MDDQNQPTIPTPTDTSSELAHVTQEMYKKNLELAERNKTLSLLRKIDEIVLGAVTEPKAFAQSIVDTVVSEGDIRDVTIFLINHETESLDTLAQSQTEGFLRAAAEFNKRLYEDSIPLTQTDNLIVIALKERKVQTTTRLYDLLLSTFSENDAQKIQEILDVTTILIYPLIVRNEVLGVMIVGSDEKDELLATYRKDLLDRLAVTVGIAIDNALLYRNIQAANEQLKQLDKLKDEFVSLASHELRTPMTAIKSYMWMLIENNMIQDPKGQEYLHHAYEATDRLITLVNDMLNVSRIESGRMIITMNPVNLSQLISDVIDEIKPASDKQNITLNFVIPETPLPLVKVDVNKIKEVLINLIGNAIKFTPAGGNITVTAHPDAGMVVTKITDTGKGILPEDMSTLFTKFGLIEKNYASKHPTEGTGLGLYICKSIIEMHGGKISVQSDGRDKGTTFSFTLQIAS